MKVLNIHSRTIAQSKENISELLRTLTTKDDKVWPQEQWPAMRFKEGLKIGSKGGHGPIRYTVKKYNPGDLIEFQFSKPNGLNGIHRLEIEEIEPQKTEIKHTIDIETSGIGIFTWPLAIRWLHDALIEDAFDKVENHFSTEKKRTKWSGWVKFLRKMMGA